MIETETRPCEQCAERNNPFGHTAPRPFCRRCGRLIEEGEPRTEPSDNKRTALCCRDACMHPTRPAPRRLRWWQRLLGRARWGVYIPDQYVDELIDLMRSSKNAFHAHELGGLGEEHAYRLRKRWETLIHDLEQDA